MAETNIGITEGSGTNCAALAEGDGDLVPKVALSIDNGSDVAVDVSTSNPVPTQGVANDGVDIGDVDVTSVVPGTGATNLGKAIDSVVGATDTGIGLLAQHKEDLVHLSSADGDYDILTLDSLGQLHVNPEGHHIFDNFNATTGWSALGNDTLNLATTGKHAIGTAALTFDKVDGAANTVFAGIQKTVSSTDLGDISPHDLIHGVLYIPDLTDVSYAFIRIGTDSSNYNEWRISDTNLTAATFETYSLTIGDADHTGITGNGWDPSAITYIAVGVAFDAETNTLAGIIFDQLSYHTNQHTSASFNSEVTSSVNSANVNINKIGNKVVDTQAGNVSTGTQRITIATDDANLSAIKTATELIDNAISGSEMQVDVVAALPAGTNAIGKLAANSGVDIGDVDVTSLAHGKTIKTDYTNVTASGNTTLVAAVAAKKIKVFACDITTTTTSEIDVKIQDGAGGTNLWGGVFQAPSGSSSGISKTVSLPGHLFETSVNTLLNMNLSGAGDFHVSLSYIEEA